VSEQVTVYEMPICDFCGVEAKVDGKTKAGPWAFMCWVDWRGHGIQRFGTGYGQVLVSADAVAVDAT